MTIQLAAIVLPDHLTWSDEFGWTPIVQVTTYTESGVLVREESAMQTGRPITLSGDWASRATVDALYALAATASSSFTLQLYSRTFSVAFRRPALKAEPIVDYAGDPAATDRYQLTLNLMTV